MIVPVGAKGGFVAKRLPASGTREEVQAEGVACYQTFIRALLDLTDNIVDGRIVPPPRVVRRDGDDAYLVVAADKGTATFSDIANAISAEYGFWLGDAFASGGSAGLRPQEDGHHRARRVGMREAALPRDRHRHRRRRTSRCAGIGDMSGDVFGNGMLLSRHIRLLAAFDHRTSFSIRTRMPAASFAERAAPVRPAALELGRLRPQADLARRRRVSRARAKSITLSPAGAARMLGLESASAARRTTSSAPSCACRWTCCGTAASAPT